MLLLYSYFKNPKYLSMWFGPFSNRAKTIYLHKKINEKRCQKPLGKILSQLCHIKLISHGYRVTHYATDKYMFPWRLRVIVVIPEYCVIHQTLNWIILPQSKIKNIRSYKYPWFNIFYESFLTNKIYFTNYDHNNPYFVRLTISKLIITFCYKI